MNRIKKISSYLKSAKLYDLDDKKLEISSPIKDFQDFKERFRHVYEDFAPEDRERVLVKDYKKLKEQGVAGREQK
jgi:hypothetical protein